jgi:NAD(P)-dependent dehydrogenase (short-subunit alcohol dehydrogenase family)
MERAKITMAEEKRAFPPQHQERHPGVQVEMKPKPIDEDPNYKASGKLDGKIAVITGGDSGIGRAVGYAFAKEGADIAFVYLNEHQDAEQTVNRIREIGSKAISVSGDIGDPVFCRSFTNKVINEFGKIDILVNNAAEQYYHENIEDIPVEEVEKTFRANIMSFFFMTQSALKYMKEGTAIINTGSAVAYVGYETLLDYSSTQGAVITFTRSLSQSLADRGIRVNAVAPGPVWIPLIPSSFPAEEVSKFGTEVPMKRAAQPWEIAPAYVFLAYNGDSSYIAGQTIHLNGGMVVNA